MEGNETPYAISFGLEETSGVLEVVIDRGVSTGRLLTRNGNVSQTWKPLWARRICFFCDQTGGHMTKY
jgi:hypothetical protein